MGFRVEVVVCRALGCRREVLAWGVIRDGSSGLFTFC